MASRNKVYFLQIKRGVPFFSLLEGVKKRFTWIKLLAVIVTLAVIALIITYLFVHLILSKSISDESNQCNPTYGSCESYENNNSAQLDGVKS